MGSVFTLSCFQISYISAQRCQLNVELWGGGVLMASALFISAERNNMSLSKFIPE